MGRKGNDRFRPVEYKRKKRSDSGKNKSNSEGTARPTEDGVQRGQGKKELEVPAGGHQRLLRGRLRGGRVGGAGVGGTRQ